MQNKIIKIFTFEATNNKQVIKNCYKDKEIDKIKDLFFEQIKKNKPTLISGCIIRQNSYLIITMTAAGGLIRFDVKINKSNEIYAEVNAFFSQPISLQVKNNKQKEKLSNLIVQELS